MATLKEAIGCWLHERGRLEFALRFPVAAAALGMTWMDHKNRHERILTDHRSEGRICEWQDSSELTVARFFPETGARLLKRCLEEWPIYFQSVAQDTQKCVSPDVSVIIGVRGTARLPQFTACLASLRAQQNVTCEIIVVEQSWEPLFAALVPRDVVYIHSKTPSPDMAFNRSWAFNVGAVAARGRFLVLHDADMIVPARFASAIAERLDGQLEAIRLARYIFYLDEQTSRQVWSQCNFDVLKSVSSVVQNNPTPVAVRRESYLRIGGHDETFFGWGGEDNEFMDRLRTLNLSEGSFLPLVHLWHPEAPNRSGDRNAAHLAAKLSTEAKKRIEIMQNSPLGQEFPVNYE